MKNIIDGDGFNVKPIFTVDWETWFNAVIPKYHWWKYQSDIKEPTMFLLNVLSKYEVTAIFYLLGWLWTRNYELVSEIRNRGHIIGSHGEWHNHGEKSDARYFRSPYWDTTPMPFPPSGGFFFRALPLWYIKWAVIKSGVFWIHPHDIMNHHPALDNKLLHFKRQFGLKQSRLKLNKLLSEVEFGKPS